MGYHHVALATAKLEATHRFYTEAMGFELVKTVVGPTPEGGWAKHVFYRNPEPGPTFEGLARERQAALKGTVSSRTDVLNVFKLKK